MTGIERLRRLAGSQDMGNAWTAMLANELCDIADQIEREVEEQSARLYDERLGEETGVCELLGVEPVDDPLTSLRRHVEGLRDTIENLRLELGEARDEAAWVREHGGLERVKAQRCESMPRAAYERKKAGFLDHIAECERALRRRNQRIEELEGRVRAITNESAELRKRAMPEGMEWPKVDGKPVDFVTGYEPSLGVLEAVSIYSNGACEVMGHDGIIMGVKEIHVATPKVLDADGVEISVGEMIYSVENGDWFTVIAVDADGGDIHVRWGYDFEDKTGTISSKQLTHRAPVLAADGEPLREGQTVWDENGDELVIGALEDGGHTVTCRYADVGDAIPVHGMWSPSDLTHTKPEIDTWERLEEDAEKDPCDYFGFDGEEACGKCPASGKNCEQTMARDLVRRARALAGDA